MGRSRESRGEFGDEVLEVDELRCEFTDAGRRPLAQGGSTVDVEGSDRLGAPNLEFMGDQVTLFGEHREKLSGVSKVPGHLIRSIAGSVRTHRRRAINGCRPSWHPEAALQLVGHSPQPGIAWN